MTEKKKKPAAKRRLTAKQPLPRCRKPRLNAADWAGDSAH